MQTQYNYKTQYAVLLVGLLLICSPVGHTEEVQLDQLLELSIDELMEVEIYPTASLTRTTERNLPASVTVIYKEDIIHSGARSLDELMDQYVPNFQMFLHSWEYQHIGVRGNIFDRDDKYLLLVNGQIMNERVHYGALSERDLPMLDDIQRVEVVRGAGSALYGPGALYMVINVITENTDTFQGLGITNKLGALDEFYSTEVKYGTKLKQGGSFYLYTGLASQPGMQESGAPYVSGAPYTIKGRSYSGTTPESFGELPNHNASFRDRTKVKLFSHYKKKRFQYLVPLYPRRSALLHHDQVHRLGWLSGPRGRVSPDKRICRQYLPRF